MMTRFAPRIVLRFDWLSRALVVEGLGWRRGSSRSWSFDDIADIQIVQMRRGLEVALVLASGERVPLVLTSVWRARQQRLVEQIRELRAREEVPLRLRVAAADAEPATPERESSADAETSTTEVDEGALSYTARAAGTDR